MFKRLYDDGALPPQRGGRGFDWHVHCRQGLLEVLAKGEYADPADGDFTVNAANTAYIRAAPGDELWKQLSRIAATHEVMVFPASLGTRDYVPWNPDSKRPQEFDAVRIRTRTAAAG
jgi:hypothetical protein